MFLYSIDSWLLSELYSESNLDSKIDTIGPFAQAFSIIITTSAFRRSDIDDLKELFAKKGTKLYRDAALTKKEL